MSYPIRNNGTSDNCFQNPGKTHFELLSHPRQAEEQCSSSTLSGGGCKGSLRRHTLQLCNDCAVQGVPAKTNSTFVHHRSGGALLLCFCAWQRQPLLPEPATAQWLCSSKGWRKTSPLANTNAEEHQSSVSAGGEDSLCCHLLKLHNDAGDGVKS